MIFDEETRLFFTNKMFHDARNMYVYTECFIKIDKYEAYFIKYLYIILKANLYQLYRDSTIEIKMMSFIIFIEHSVYRTGQPTLSAQGNPL